MHVYATKILNLFLYIRGSQALVVCHRHLPFTTNLHVQKRMVLSSEKLFVTFPEDFR